MISKYKISFNSFNGSKNTFVTDVTMSECKPNSCGEARSAIQSPMENSSTMAMVSLSFKIKEKNPDISYLFEHEYV